MYFKWGSCAFFKPSLSGVCCCWFIRRVTVEFCCIQIFTGVFFVLQAQFACSPSVTCTGAALAWRVLAAWHHSVVLWSNFFLISLFPLHFYTFLSWALSNLRDIDQFVTQLCKKKQELCPHIANTENWSGLCLNWEDLTLCLHTILGLGTTLAEHDAFQYKKIMVYFSLVRESYKPVQEHWTCDCNG